VICDFGDFDFGFLTAIAIAIAIVVRCHPNPNKKNAGEPAITREIRQANQRPFWWFGVV
jgi:hypothetical protein